MELLIDLFGFLSVMLSGLARTAQSIMLGGIFFSLFMLRKEDAYSTIYHSIARIIRLATIVLFLILVILLALHIAVLHGSMGLALADSVSDIYGLIIATRLLLVVGIIFHLQEKKPGFITLSLALIELAVTVMTSHAASRIDNQIILSFATLLHHLGAALWIGGMPAFLIALKKLDGHQLGSVGLRFSHLSALSVAVILISAIGMGLLYIGSWDAIYGTAYGLMAFTKSILFGSLLLLGLSNFIVIRRSSFTPSSKTRLIRFVEVELGIGIAIFFAAASMTSLPPAVDLTDDRVTFEELSERLTPKLPSLVSPDINSLAISQLEQQLKDEAQQSPDRPKAFIPGAGLPAPRNAADIRWSEYNHHYSGIIVLIIGLLAFLDKIGPTWIRTYMRHWPLTFILLAIFLLLRSEAEYWPIGDIPLSESIRDPEFIQHKLVMMLITGFAIFEWSVKMGWAKNWMRNVFPLACAAGGVFLLSHSHSLANTKELLLIEFTHTPLAVLGIWSGWAMWLELHLHAPEKKWAGWIWPLFFCLVGLSLIFYREI